MRRDLGFVRSTVHVVDNPVDSGSAISFSEAIYPNEDMSDREVHQQLKEKEHAIYSKTLLLLGRGILMPSAIPYSAAQIEELLHA